MSVETAFLTYFEGELSRLAMIEIILFIPAPHSNEALT